MSRLGGIDPDTGAQSILFGGFEGDPLDIENIIIVWSEYKKDDESIASPSVTWNSTAGMWKIIIPEEYITQLGSSWLNLSGTAMIPVAFEIETVARMSYKKIVPSGSYVLSSVGRTITLLGEYSSASLEQIVSIYNLTKGCEIYNSLNPRKRRSFMTAPADKIGTDISVVTGVISFIETAQMADDDKIMIVANLPA